MIAIAAYVMASDDERCISNYATRNQADESFHHISAKIPHVQQQQQQQQLSSTIVVVDHIQS